MQTYFFSLFLLVATTLTSTAVMADDDNSAGWVDRAVKHVQEIWQEGRSDVYVPFHAYHVRSNYSKEDIREFREETWGLGYGRSRTVDDGNWEGVYGMAFLDSNSDVQPIAGYGYQWVKGEQRGLHAGAGYTALVTARARFANYMLPIPAVLPMASVGYNNVQVNSSFVPGFKGFGQIFFFWSTVSF